MGRLSSSKHLLTGAQGRAASPPRSASHPLGSEQISYSLGVERAPGHGLQILGQRRGKPAQRQNDHRHKPLAEPTLPRPGHLPGGQAALWDPLAPPQQRWPRLPVPRCTPSCSGAHPPQPPALKCSPPAGFGVALLRPAGQEDSLGSRPQPGHELRPPRARSPGLSAARGATGAVSPRVIPPDSARLSETVWDCAPSPQWGLVTGDSAVAQKPRPFRDRHPWEEVGVSPTHELVPGAPDRSAQARAPFLQATLRLRAVRPPTASTSARAPLSVLIRAGRRCRASKSHQFAPLKPRPGGPAVQPPSPSSPTIAPEGLRPVRGSHTSHCCPARIDSLRRG